MKWYKEFYQNDPQESRTYDFYHRQRSAKVILEETKKIKNGLYEAKVISIESTEEFRRMAHAGGCSHQYHIGETFWLRKHKDKGKEWWTRFSGIKWFDPRHPGQDYCEEFYLLES